MLYAAPTLLVLAVPDSVVCTELVDYKCTNHYVPRYLISVKRALPWPCRSPRLRQSCSCDIYLGIVSDVFCRTDYTESAQGYFDRK